VLTGSSAAAAVGLAGSSGLTVSSPDARLWVQATYTGDTVINSGQLNIAGSGGIPTNSAVSIASGATVNLTSFFAATNINRTIGGLTGAGILYGIGGTVTVNKTSGSDTFSGDIQGGQGLIKAGAGTLALGGASSYTGSTAVNAGTLLIANGAALGATSGGTTVALGAQLRLNATNSGFTVGNESLAIVGQGVTSGGALRNAAGDNTWQGKVTLGADATIGAASGTSLTMDVASGNAIEAAGFNLTFDGAGTNRVLDSISLGAGGLTKIGSGTTILAAANSYSGATDIQGGRLTLSGNGRLGSGAITISNANTGTLELAVTGTNVMANDISGAGALLSSAGETRFTGAVTTTGALTVSGSTVRIGNGGTSGSLSGNTTLSDNTAQLVFDRSNAYAHSGTISGSGSVTKSGAGTTTLTGNNSFSGALAVNAGVLELNASSGAAAASASTISVATSATLLISKSDQVNDSAAVTLSGGTIQRASGVSEVFGNLNITAASFLNFGSGTTGNLQFQSYTNTGSALVTVQSFFQGNSLQFASATFNVGNLAQFSFDNGYTTSIQGDYFTITAIPEPSTCLAAAGLFALLLWPMRRALFASAKRSGA
jgi:autotransporter-associated beta strand protein